MAAGGGAVKYGIPLVLLSSLCWTLRASLMNKGDAWTLLGCGGCCSGQA